MTILLVGERTPKSKLVEQGLSREGLKVVRARGHEALRGVQEANPRLVLLDLSRDATEGSQMIQTIHSIVRRLPVIALLGRDAVGGRGGGEPLAGAADCLSPPWRVGELLARIRAQLRIRALEEEIEQTTRSKRDLETLFEGILDSVEIIDPDYRILRINPTNPRLYGVQPEELVGRVCYQVYQERMEPCPSCAVSETLRTRQPAFAELTHNRHREFAHQYTYPLFDEGGALSGVICYVQDVTEKKRLERQMLQTEKLSALGELISGITHELNNPLAAILLYAQLLQRTEISEKVRGGLESIQRESIRCQKVVQNLLSFARQHKPVRILVNPNEILESMLDLQEYQLKVNNIQVIKRLDRKLPSTLADPYQLQQVFLNILINAHQAILSGPGRGTLVVKTERVRSQGKDRSSRYADPAFIQISIQNDGPDIPPENLKRIFDPFFTTKDVGQGTGLGLSVAYGIVHEHGGSIYARSQPGQGATFIIELPIAGQGGVAGELVVSGVKEEVGGKRKSRILVVDDEEDLLQGISEILRMDGHEVHTAKNGRIALDMVNDCNYDVIICDIKMPEVNGIQFYQEVEQRDFLLARRILFSTGDIANAETYSFLGRTGRSWIKKPFLIEELQEAIQRVLSDREVKSRPEESFS
ncbi:MAG: response regulator [Candidatus Tectomicrobia bacterium]|uniref:histidine kinase n=1 Tax=Tectimicrobiota bacterium TaxID=2528274 RepID=A0A932CR17_UNCTE|nr:response regulator [Candidatus Tectomicrobia bacterium]